MLDLRYQRVRRSREDLIDHLYKFNLDMKFTVGIWYFNPAPSRFHEPYGKSYTIEERLNIIAETAEYGVKGIEAHYPNEINEDNIDLYRRLEKETGIKLVNIGPNIFYSRDFEFGSLSNPIEKYRKKAKEILINCLKLVKESGASHCGIWPGIDGYTYSFGTPFYQMWDLFEEAVAEAMDEVPGVTVAIEPKPYEPVPNNIYRTTADGILAARDIESRLRSDVNRRLLEEGYTLVGLQPEIGHILMGFEDPAYALSRIARDGRLVHVHWNSQPLGNYDQDLNVGVVGWEQAEAALYALKMIGYRGYIGIDINPERIPPKKAVEINTTVLRIMNERINSLPHEKIIDCYYNPEEHRGDLELILAEARRFFRQ
ncbi:MAG: sugar phosphate isomerase/epimerase family protein [Candidatus Bathyarchaeia archaeon]